MKDSEVVTNELYVFYENRIEKQGDIYKGVGWPTAFQAELRYNRMLNVIDDIHKYEAERPTILDVSCGCGGLLDYINRHNLNIYYTGLDILPKMIELAKKRHQTGNFINQNILTYVPDCYFDYIICNGVMTLKVGATIPQMNPFLREVLTKMYDICNVGFAFNVFSTYVGWFGERIYYKSPVEILAYCLSEFSIHVKIDHSYRDYEYTV